MLASVAAALHHTGLLSAIVNIVLRNINREVGLGQDGTVDLVVPVG